MSTSSDDEPSLAQLFGHQSQPTADRSDDSDLPDWIQSHTPAQQRPIDVSSSDHDDFNRNASPSRAAGAGTSSAAAAAADTEQGGSDQAAAAAHKAKQPAGNAGRSAAAAPTVAAATDRSEVQVLLPEKLIRNKVLIELEPASHQATELSGDAGAVGRLIASSATAEEGQFKIDLKGVLYQATVLPLAGTALVVNIGPTDAKVESVMNDFVWLREESSYHDTGLTLEGGYGMAELMADDEDNYQVAGDEGKEGGEKTAAKKAAAKRSKAGSSKPAASRSLNPTKTGVKKKPAKSKAAGKGSKATPKKPKATPKSKAAPKTAAKPKPAKKKKKQQSDEKDDWDDSDYSD